MQDLALALRVSRQTLSLWVKKWPEFPVQRRGTNGAPYQFSVADVVAFLRAKKAEEERLLGERDDALAQLVLPLLEQEQPQASRVSLKDEMDAIKLSRLRREEAERLGQLVPAAEVRTALTTALANWQRGLHQALRRAADELHLPPDVARQISARVADAQREFVRELRDQVGVQDAA